MSEPFLAEIKIVGFNFAPRGWAFCDGQILPINQNQSLYSLLGTVYGGDGRTSFALPDLRGRTPVGLGVPASGGGADVKQGQKGGQETHTLAVTEMPNHNHKFQGSTAAGTLPAPVNNSLAASRNSIYHDYVEGTTTLVRMNPAMIANVGGGQAHENMQPYLAVNFCIALRGLFPSRN